MKLNSTISSMNPELEGKGYIIAHDDDLTPRLIPTPKNYFGMDDMGHILFILAGEIIYKFQCEDFQTENFIETKRFLKAYHQNTMKRKPWFPSIELRTIRKDPNKFYKIFKFTLEEDVKKYNGRAAKGLVKDILNELQKVKV